MARGITRFAVQYQTGKETADQDVLMKVLSNLGAERSVGFLFNDYTPAALRNTVSWAVEVTRNGELKKNLVTEAALSKHDWKDRVPQYIGIFQLLAGVLNEQQPYPHLVRTIELVNSLRP